MDVVLKLASVIIGLIAMVALVRYFLPPRITPVSKRWLADQRYSRNGWNDERNAVD